MAALGSTGACLDVAVENPNDPAARDVFSTPEAIQSLVRGTFIPWWHVDNNRWPAAAMQVAADGTSSSWANYGMREAGSEPRVPFNNSPTYTYSQVNEIPWGWSSEAMSSVLEGFKAGYYNPDMRQRMVADLGQEGVERLEAFGILVQALTLSSVATIFDQGFAVIDTMDQQNLDLQNPDKYPEIWDRALARYDDFLELAQGGEWEVPAVWVGCKEAWTAGRAVEIARAYRALYRAAMARDPVEREAVDWAAVRADATAGRSRFVGALAFNDNCNTAWTGSKHPVLMFPDWGRADYRWIGPADASGGWERWIAAELNDRTMFRIDTDDRRITAGDPESDGTYFQYTATCPFPLDRGVYHCSHYRVTRWDYIREEEFVTDWPLFDTAVFDFLIAEADYRSGDLTSAMDMVNKYRVNSGGLPPFNDPSGVAPGGSRCVPQNPDGSCGDLWAALKYEKQIEVHGYGVSGSQFVDDRGWGDLVGGTWAQLPIPGAELLLIGLANYTCPCRGDGDAADTGGDAVAMAVDRDGFPTEEDIREMVAVMNARIQNDFGFRSEVGNVWK